MPRNDTCLASAISVRSEPPSSGRHPVPTAPTSGVPARFNDAEHIATAKRMKTDGHTGKDIAKYLGVSRATLYRYLVEELA